MKDPAHKAVIEDIVIWVKVRALFLGGFIAAIVLIISCLRWLLSSETSVFERVIFVFLIGCSVGACYYINAVDRKRNQIRKMREKENNKDES